MAQASEGQLVRATDVESRLEEEKNPLQNYFWPEKFPIYYMNGERCFERVVKLKNGRVYTLRVYIEAGYPHIMPSLVVCNPTMPNWTGSHKTHTLPPRNGLLRICYYHPWCWTSDIMIYQIFKKGKQWLKAYEKYLVSEKPICEYLEKMRPNEEEIKRAEYRQREFVRKFFPVFSVLISSLPPLSLEQNRQ